MGKGKGTMKDSKTKIEERIVYQVLDYGGECGKFKRLKDARRCKREFSGQMAEIIKHTETFILIETKERVS
jgi:hypothetical protein